MYTEIALPVPNLYYSQAVYLVLKKTSTTLTLSSDCFNNLDVPANNFKLVRAAKTELPSKITEGDFIDIPTGDPSQKQCIKVKRIICSPNISLVETILGAFFFDFK